MQELLEKLRAMFVSRRFLAAVAGVIVIIVNTIMPTLPEDVIQNVVWIVIGWISVGSRQVQIQTFFHLGGPTGFQLIFQPDLFESHRPPQFLKFSNPFAIAITLPSPSGYFLTDSSIMLFIL